MRLFVAIDIPDTVREALSDVCGRLRRLYPDARWVRLEGVHVTLKFIGEAPTELADRILVALRGVRPLGPIELGFAGLGFFPHPRRPRVLWAGVSAGDGLSQLVASIETRLEPLGVACETRSFSPHITLARFDSTNGLDALCAAVEQLSTAEFGQSSVRQFYLYQSILKRGGAEYTRLANFEISGAPAS